MQWPTGTGAKGNAGVAGAVQQTTGAVGYVEQAYALQHNFTYASVKNKSGTFVAPTLASTSAAGEGVTVPANLGIKIINSAAASAYPITSQTFIVVNKDLCKAGIPGGESGRQGRREVPRLRAGRRTVDPLARPTTRRCPPSILAKSKEAAAGLQCNGATLRAGP